MYCNRPKNPLISFSLLGGGMFNMALIFDGLTSIPLSLTRKPNNFPTVTPKVHFCEFNLSLYSLILSKNFLKFTVWLSLAFPTILRLLTQRSRWLGSSWKSMVQEHFSVVAAQYRSFIVKWWEKYRPQGLVTYFWQIPKIMLISILSKEVTKVFVIGIQNKINLNKRYVEEKKDVAWKST